MVLINYIQSSKLMVSLGNFQISRLVSKPQIQDCFYSEAIFHVNDTILLFSLLIAVDD